MNYDKAKARLAAAISAGLIHDETTVGVLTELLETVEILERTLAETQSGALTTAKELLKTNMNTTRYIHLQLEIAERLLALEAKGTSCP